MTTLVEPHHFIDFAGPDRTTCPHCQRNVAYDEPVVVSLKDPQARWLPADCYEAVWATEIARISTAPFEMADFVDANEPFDPDDVINLPAEDGDGNLIEGDDGVDG